MLTKAIPSCFSSVNNNISDSRRRNTGWSDRTLQSLWFLDPSQLVYCTVHLLNTKLVNIITVKILNFRKFYQKVSDELANLLRNTAYHTQQLRCIWHHASSSCWSLQNIPNDNSCTSDQHNAKPSSALCRENSSSHFCIWKLDESWNTVIVHMF